MAEQSGVGASDAGLHMRWPSRVTLSLSVTVLSVLLFVILIRGQWLKLYGPEHVAQSSGVFAPKQLACSVCFPSALSWRRCGAAGVSPRCAHGQDDSFARVPRGDSDGVRLPGVALRLATRHAGVGRAAPPPQGERPASAETQGARVHHHG